MLARLLATPHVSRTGQLHRRCIKRVDSRLLLTRYGPRFFSSTRVSTQTEKSVATATKVETSTAVSGLGPPLSSILDELEDMKANKHYIEAIDIFKKHRENVGGTEIPLPYSINMMSVIKMSIIQTRADYTANASNQLIVRTHKGHYKYSNVFYADKILRNAHLAFEIYRDVLEQCSEQAEALHNDIDKDNTGQQWELVHQHSRIAIDILKALANIPQPILMEHAPLVEQSMAVYNNVHDMYVQMIHRLSAKQADALREQHFAQAAEDGKGLEFFMSGSSSATSKDVDESLSSNKRYTHVVAEILPVLIRIAGKVHRYDWVENMFGNLEQMRESNQLSPGQTNQATLSTMSAAAYCGEMEMVHRLWDRVLVDHQENLKEDEGREYSQNDSSKYGKLTVGLLNNYLLHCKRHGAHVHAFRAYQAMKDVGRSRVNWDTYGHLLSLSQFRPRNATAIDQEDHGNVVDIDMLDWPRNKLDRRRKSVQKEVAKRMAASLSAQEYDGLPSVPITLFATHTGAYLVKEGHLGQIMNAESVMERDDKDAALCKVWQRIAYYLKKDGEIVHLMQLIDSIQIHKPAIPALIMLDLVGHAVSLLDTLGHREDALLFLDSHMHLVDDIISSTRSQKRVSRILKMDGSSAVDEDEMEGWEDKDAQRWAAGRIPLKLLFAGLQAPSSVDDGERPTTEVGPTGAGKKDDLLPLVLSKVLEHCIDEYGATMHQGAMVQILVYALESSVSSSEAEQCLQLYKDLGRTVSPSSEDTVLFRRLLTNAIEKNKHDIKQDAALQVMVADLWKD